MAIDTAAIGRELEKTSLHVDAGRLRFFAKAIGETNPVFIDSEAAAAAGHRDLPVPPTFLFSVGLESPDSFAFLVELGVDLRTVLHGSQKFTYHAVAHAGDDLTVTARIADIYEKKAGLLQFIVLRSLVHDQEGTLVAELENVYIVRNAA
ncbi:UPF0336 protein [Acrocarpospora pleiomorpha]|uniref:UPF0336 protein n=1 Tax=Acrocarpospora pleiomorpha TaxID=90975 RepID=A0A5M3X7V7_9ACTN|nr:MaoC family dehydratase N-terminal domain-containing protein [Acrocarpospora pleiomorpha]GES17180.1 UPF0336 protein [Acrocarpospora pleiomorpha]